MACTGVCAPSSDSVSQDSSGSALLELQVREPALSGEELGERRDIFKKQASGVFLDSDAGNVIINRACSELGDSRTRNRYFSQRLTHFEFFNGFCLKSFYSSRDPPEISNPDWLLAQQADTWIEKSYCDPSCAGQQVSFEDLGYSGVLNSWESQWAGRAFLRGQGQGLGNSQPRQGARKGDFDGVLSDYRVERPYCILCKSEEGGVFLDAVSGGESEYTVMRHNNSKFGIVKDGIFLGVPKKIAIFLTYCASGGICSEGALIISMV